MLRSEMRAYNEEEGGEESTTCNIKLPCPRRILRYRDVMQADSGVHLPVILPSSAAVAPQLATRQASRR